MSNQKCLLLPGTLLPAMHTRAPLPVWERPGGMGVQMGRWTSPRTGWSPWLLGSCGERKSPTSAALNCTPCAWRGRLSGVHLLQQRQGPVPPPALSWYVGTGNAGVVPKEASVSRQAPRSHCEASTQGWPPSCPGVSPDPGTHRQAFW